jgi:chemotaxis protein methyltransferase CheR
MDDNSFRQLLDRLGLSWKGYAKVRRGVKKRICRHMQEHGYHSLDEYLHALEKPEILKEVECLFGVSISHFFRDRYVWKILGNEILPDMIKKYDEHIHVWSAGCALGQEAYSFAILWDMTEGTCEKRPQLFLLASDSNPDYIQRAKEGAYGRSSLKGLSQEIKTTYFNVSEDGSHFSFVENIKKDITWQVHDLMREPPPAGKFHIILLRNSLLTYYREERIMPVLLKIVDSLEDGGFLIIGCQESLPSPIRMLSPHKRCTYLFCRAHNCIPHLSD